MGRRRRWKIGQDKALLTDPHLQKTSVDSGKLFQMLSCNLIWSDSLFFWNLEEGLSKGLLGATIGGKAVGEVEEEEALQPD